MQTDDDKLIEARAIADAWMALGPEFRTRDLLAGMIANALAEAAHPFRQSLGGSRAVREAVERCAQIAESGDWRDGTASSSERRIATAIRAQLKEPTRAD